MCSYLLFVCRIEFDEFLYILVWNLVALQGLYTRQESFDDSVYTVANLTTYNQDRLVHVDIVKSSDVVYERFYPEGSIESRTFAVTVAIGTPVTKHVGVP